jgi:hypothetical protein
MIGGNEPRLVPKQEFCYIKYPDGTAPTTSASSLMETASIALKWIEVDRQSFGTALILRDSDILEIQVGTGQTTRRYRVRIGRVRE